MSMMNKTQQELFCLLCDPIIQFDGFDVNSESFMSLAELYNWAEAHDVVAIIARKLMQVKNASLAHDEGSYVKFQEALRNATILAMNLDQHRIRLTKHLHELNIEHRIVKGATFASSLYPNLVDRPYTDVDIVIHERDFKRAHSVIQMNDFTWVKKNFWDKSVANKEHKYLHNRIPNTLIELHQDLVHMRALRGRKKMDLTQIELAYNGDENKNAGHFVVAVAHASMGHKFHNMKLMVDCLQAFRALDLDDVMHIKEIAPALNMNLEFAQCTNLCAGLFPQDDVIASVKKFQDILNLPNNINLVLSEDVIMAPFKQSSNSKWRRRIFRLHQLVRS